jgi:Cellulase (glycosyl hydrolase family 5)/Domain of unknown function (DUF5060)
VRPDDSPMPMPRLPLLAAIFLAQFASAGAKPIEFEFVAPVSTIDPNPYSRDIWVKVTTPSGQELNLPAYYADGGLYAVHVRPNEIGTYRFGAVSETTRGEHHTDMIVSLVTPAAIQNAVRTRLPAILRNPKEPRRFMRSDGVTYVPFGANLAWAADGTTDRLAYYDRAFREFAKANLNWMRVWMAHWDGLNLDWLPADMGPSPRPGTFSEDVAQNWDRILADAEENGVYVQMVLQHHGQYTSFNDSNWAQNPWNAANKGGFLKTPSDFFTDPNAAVITLVKYRYIVARWGWSPAIVSWELFNEVHWTDSMRQGHEDDVARWHGVMANYIRSVDAYGHLITTSTENLASPVYAKMDYCQPHLYAANLIAAARIFGPAYATLDRPAFYGEVGDDHEALPDDVKASGLDIVPPVWASVMGQGDVAAQPWNGWRLLEQNRLGELGAVFRFVAGSHVSAQRFLKPFSAVVQCAEQVPMRIAAGEVWQHRAALDIDYPVDGTEPIDAGNVASTLVGSSASIAEGYPYRAGYHLNLPAPTAARVRVDSVAPKGGSLTVSVDDKVVASHQWAGAPATPDPAALEFQIEAGRHTLVLEDTGPDWIGVSGIDLGLEIPVLALIGRRNDSFIEAWVWHRTNVYAVNPGAPLAGTIILDDVPAGSWKVTWWDTLKGVPSESQTLQHPGGVLRLPTPPISRHAAVVLTKSP